MKNFLFFAVIALVCSGCAHPTFIPYAGAQQNWPTSPGAFVDSTHALPVYYGNPPVDYLMLGQIHLWTQANIVNLVAAAASEAKTKGADAVIIGQGNSSPAGAVVIGSAYTSHGYTYGSAVAAPITQRELTAVAIKWKNTTGNPH